ncbi:hypothetical protein [Romboutsia sp. 1001713B170131_170501_G6]|uniref:hypothetical protein n=1 Tax=Romboutsia sp. 1001713B170131_170501_G6 TaxID=2787108 RepID=UPI0018AA582F|nr:hypothetical protein [Romboutsia sp. 1001713B170131_170501_G6]
MKRFFITGAIALLTISNSTVVSLADGLTVVDNNMRIEDIAPRYQYISSARSNISINSSGVSTISCSALGVSGVTKIEITAYLQQYKGGRWVKIASWSGSGTNNCLVSKTKSVTKGYSYRVSAKIKVYKGTQSEGITVNSNTAKY